MLARRAMMQMLGASGEGGGSNRFVCGEFTTGAEATISEVNIPYTGNGYPIIVCIRAKGGWMNNEEYTALIKRYVIGEWGASKYCGLTAPDYYGSGYMNMAFAYAIYKNSASNATTYSYGASRESIPYDNYSSPAGKTHYACVHIVSATEIHAYVSNMTGSGSGCYGLMPNLTYEYFIIYSE